MLLPEVLTLLGLLTILSAFLFLLTTSSTAFTTRPPLEPPQAARDPMGVRLARYFLSMMMG